MIKTLLNTLKQDKETFEVPRSVQDAIPIRRLWPDGVFQFGSKFSKTLRFSDINYAIASKEDKTAMFLDYSELLNALDAGSTTKITINNKRVARENVEQEILIPRRDDHLDGYRAEYNTMLLDKATNAANSVVQERYITLSVHRKSAEEARSFFDRTMHDVTAHLHRLDSHCEELDAVERLRVLHDFYRKGPDGKPEIDPQEAETVRRIYRRYLDGCSLSQIQQELEADRVPTAQAIQRWSYQVIRNILTNERYIGDAMLGKTFTTDCISKRVKKNNGERGQSYVRNNHPAIIPREMFYRVQEEMARRSSKRKVMQKTGKTELGKYSAKYALSELLVCGECGTPYKRVTWARNGKKRIVWRCISRLEFGTKYCHNSPTLDEEKLHQAIQEAINEFAQAGTEVKEDMLTFTAMAWGGDTVGGVSLIDLRQKLKDITAQQALLLDQVLEHMDDEILNAQLKAMMDEKQALQERIADAEQSETHNAAQESRMAELREWMAKLEVNQQYSDEQVRMAVERITVVDAETIRIRFRYPGAELEKKL